MSADCQNHNTSMQWSVKAKLDKIHILDTLMNVPI